MTRAPAPHRVAPAPATDPWVLPGSLTTEATGPGPRFGDDVWDFRPFAPRSNGYLRLDFTGLPDETATLTAKEFIHSRIHHAIPLSYGSQAARPMKITNAYKEFIIVCQLFTELGKQGVTRLEQARQSHLDATARVWRETCVANTLAVRITVIQHLEAHSPHLTADRLTFVPWKGRPATHVAGRTREEETSTPRIPEQIMTPLLRAALFYVQTASRDLMTAQQEIVDLEQARASGRCGRGEAAARIEAFLQRRREQGRGVPRSRCTAWPNVPPRRSSTASCRPRTRTSSR